jgi:hypothetical protein
MSDFDRKLDDAVSATHGDQQRSEMKRRKLFGMITKTAFIAPVVASFALDALSMDKAHAVVAANGSGVTPSDRRLKRNITRIGTHALGIGLYEFNYIGSTRRHTGVMAQDVLTVRPDAVITGANGFYLVDYGALS